LSILAEFLPLPRPAKTNCNKKDGGVAVVAFRNGTFFASNPAKFRNFAARKTHTDMITLDQQKELCKRIDALRRYL
jgi:hypothetical protein